MPTSDYHHISDVLHIVEQTGADTVLDVGVGIGTWGMLCRQVLDVYRGRVKVCEWTTKLEGIEIFDGYKNPLWDLAYDQIHLGDAFELIDSLGRYELILACDVIEHFDKRHGMLLVEKLLQHGDLVILTTPRGPAPQGPAWNNPHEEHKSAWSEEDFLNVPHLYKDIGFTFMTVLSLDEAALRKIDLRRPLDILGVKKSAAELLRLFTRRLKLRLNGHLVSNS
ncbi:MAG: class I SAM-dependent methyltransferase [Deltaproteobacteria bacterium]|nr:class I SAM-dependent methyltransferase [Deltaproteobacteria bacterium]